jgi:hypothetical protein
MKRIAAIIPAAAILIFLVTACAAPAPIVVVREVTVVATVPPPTPPPWTSTPPEPTPPTQPTQAPVAPTLTPWPQETNPYDLTRLSWWADDGYLVFFHINAANTSEAEAFRQAAFEYAATEFAASYSNMEIFTPEDLRSINRQLMDCMGLNSSDLSVFILPMPNETETNRVSGNLWRGADSELEATWSTEKMADVSCVPKYGSEFRWLVLTYKGDLGSSADAFVGDVVRIIVDRVPEFQTASYWPDLLQSVHNFWVTYCFPQEPGEFDVAIRFRPEMNAMYAFGSQGHDYNTLLQVLGVSYGMQLDHWEYVPGEQCVVRK